MKKLLMIAVIGLLAACSKEEPVQSVDWYKAHEAERQAKIAQCDNNPGELELEANCLNARTAQRHLLAARKAYPDLPSASKALKD